MARAACVAVLLNTGSAHATCQIKRESLEMYGFMRFLKICRRSVIERQCNSCAYRLLKRKIVFGDIFGCILYAACTMNAICIGFSSRNLFYVRDVQIHICSILSRRHRWHHSIYQHTVIIVQPSTLSSNTTNAMHP